MTIATAIRDASYVIKACSSWIASATAQGGFAMDGSMSVVDLENAERELRELADNVASRRRALLDNVPEAEAA